MHKNLTRAAIVTGSSSGIGAALCRRIAAPNVGVVVHARQNRAGCARTAEAVQKAGGVAEIVIGDLASPDTASQLVDCAQDKFGRLDWLVANAGFPSLSGFTEGARDDLAYAFNANLFSLFSLAQSATTLLAKSDAGRIVALGSFTAHLFRPDMRSFPLSAASKGGLETLVKSLALEFAPRVTVNAVVPGYIRKDADTQDAVPENEFDEIIKRIPLGRVGEPDEVAALIQFLLSAQAAYISGQMLHINGGLVI